MSERPSGAHFDAMVDNLLQGKLVFFLGAGVNLCGRADSDAFEIGRHLPDGAELAAYLAGRARYARDQSGDLLRVAQYIDIERGWGPLYEYLHEIFQHDYLPTTVHRILASLPAAIRDNVPEGKRRFPLIITTNWDHSLEQAFTDAGEQFDIVTYIAEGPHKGKFTHGRPGEHPVLIDRPSEYVKQIPFGERAAIAKIHGSVAAELEDDSFVITENDYISYLSSGEFQALVPRDIFMRLQRCHFLFLGYSLRDWNLRVILQRLWGDDAPYNHWSVQNGFDHTEEVAWLRKKVDSIDSPLGDYMTGLAESLETWNAERAS